MGNTEQVLDDVLEQLAPSDETLAAARQRRDDVLHAAMEFPGALRGFTSGSIAHRTANDDSDADGGIVLDRRTYPTLGPDGDGEGPQDVVEDMRAFIREEIQKTHLEVAFRVSKRAIRVTYNEPLEGGTDPTVDLIVGLTRQAGAIWIPNLEQDRWDASDPEYHTKLLTAEPATLRRNRARVIRLAKGWNKQYSEPGLSAFNISVLALNAVELGMGIATGLAAFFEYAARDLKAHLTPDPAGVSGGIKLLHERDIVVQRLAHAAGLIRQALDHDADEDVVREALADLYHSYVNRPSGSTSMGAFADVLRKGNAGVGVAAGLKLRSINPELKPLKTTHSYGG